MRLIPAITAVLLAFGAPASAAPNAFWTFGFDLPLRAGQAPRFGEARHDERYAVDAKTSGQAALPGPAEPVRIASLDYDVAATRACRAVADYGADRVDMRTTGAPLNFTVAGPYAIGTPGR